MPGDLCLLPGAERLVRARQKIGALLLQTVEFGRDIDIVAIGCAAQFCDALFQFGDGFLEFEVGNHGRALVRTTLACKRVPFVDKPDEPRSIDMRIDLGGRNIGVAQQCLQCAKVRPALKQMRCKGMPQDVRTQLFGGQIGTNGQILQYLE